MERARSGREVPAATIDRLPGYLRAVTDLLAEGVTVVSSEALAERAAVQSPLLRRDLSYLGTLGIRGVGYDVKTLARAIGEHVGDEREWRLAIVGAGHLGSAMAANQVRNPRGFTVVAVIDADPALRGSQVAGCPVDSPDNLEAVFARVRPQIAVLTTPASAAQEMCDRVVAAGVTAILNCAPVVLSVPSNVSVRSVDLTGELQILAFHVGRGESEWSEL